MSEIRWYCCLWGISIGSLSKQPTFRRFYASCNRLYPESPSAAKPPIVIRSRPQISFNTCNRCTCSVLAFPSAAGWTRITKGRKAGSRGWTWKTNAAWRNRSQWVFTKSRNALRKDRSYSNNRSSKSKSLTSNSFSPWPVTSTLGR
jgi:hypothetical protein